MLAPEPPLHGDDLLSAVTTSMVALHERYYHRKPVTAKTLMLGDGRDPRQPRTRRARARPREPL